MIPVSFELEEVAVRGDPRDGGFEVAAFGSSCRLRGWTWGERKRLVELCTMRGVLDRGLFLRAFVELVYAPAPPETLAPIFAHVALSLFGVRPETRAVPVRAAERIFAERFGWSPGAIDREQCSDLDPLLAIDSARSSSPPAGWNRIEVQDG
jgi:hypothetical protein